MNLYRTKLSEKLKESLEAVVPIIAIVLILSFTIAPVPPVLLLGIIYHPQGGSYSETVIPDAETSVALWKLFESGIPHYMKDIGGSLLPIVLFFAFFQVVSLKLKKKTLIKILVGILYTYIGLVLFLTIRARPTMILSALVNGLKILLSNIMMVPILSARLMCVKVLYVES